MTYSSTVSVCRSVRWTLSFSDAILGILMSAGGSRLQWWLDPVGGMLVGIHEGDLNLGLNILPRSPRVSLLHGYTQSTNNLASWRGNLHRTSLFSLSFTRP